MGHHADRHLGLTKIQAVPELQGGFLALQRALVGVALDFSIFDDSWHAPQRRIIGPGTRFCASLVDIARTCQRNYLLCGGTMEFESSGALHVLWVRIAVSSGESRLVLGPKKADSGLLLVDIIMKEEQEKANFSIMFRDVASLSATYDSCTDITLVGLLSGAATEMDCNAWAVIRLRGNVCNLSAENSQFIPGPDGSSALYIHYYTAEESGKIHIDISK